MEPHRLKPVLLENQLQSQLDLAWKRGCRRNEAGGRADRWRRARRNRKDSCAGRRVIRAIQNVEKLSAKLQISFFRDAGVLEERKIDIRQSRPGQRSSPQISVSPGRRHYEGGRVEPLIRI